MTIPAIEFDTDRLRFSVWRADHFAPFAAMNRDAEVMQRLGMVNADADFDHPSVPEGSPLRRHCVYRMTAGGWGSLPLHGLRSVSRAGSSAGQCTP